MKTTKRRVEQFLFYDYKGIAKHLEKMALSGWQLHKITRFYWEYRKIEPQKLTYAVTYFSEASEFNPYPTENQQTFHEYCRDAGWELAAEWAQMQIFLATRVYPTPIETDEPIKLKAIHRAMKKNFLPSSILMLLLSLLQLSMQIYVITKDPIGQLSRNSVLLLTASWMILAVLMLIPLIGYAIWYRKSKAAVDRGGTCEERGGGPGKYRFISLLSAVAITLAILSMSGQHFGFVGFLAIANVAAVTALTLTVKNALKRAKAPRRVNLTASIATCVIASIALTCAIVWYIVGQARTGRFGRHPVDTYTITMPSGLTHTWEIYRDALPLRVEDLMDTDYEHYSSELTADSSFLLAHFVASQNSFPDGRSAPELSYTVTDVKLPILFDLCLNENLEKYHYGSREPEDERREYRQTDDPQWQADAVYQLYYDNEPLNDYLLCRGNRIVSIHFDFTPTPQQITVAAQKLRA